MMSGGVNGFEPPTDYGSKRSDLPFIPPPDYAKTMKFVKNPNREMNGHVIVPQPPPRQRPNLNGMANGDRISPEPMELPREQQNGNPKERILRMLQKQGVPVFPGLASKQEAVIEKPEPPIAPPQNPTSNLGPTKAYLKHLENHRNFDTMQSFRGMDNCPICKEMQEEIEQIELLSHGRTRRDHRSTSNGHSHDSAITSGRAFQPLGALVEDEMEPEEDADEIIMPFTHSSTRDYFSQPSTSSRDEKPHANGNGPDLALPARPLSDWDAESGNQLSVKFSETLKVLEMGVNWWRCENAKGEMGWVPAKQLYLMPTDYY